MGLEGDIAKVRGLTNAIHAEVQGARVTGSDLDGVRLFLATSDTLRHVLALSEELDRRVAPIEDERRRSYTPFHPSLRSSHLPPSDRIGRSSSPRP